MAKPGYQAVGLETETAGKLRAASYVLSAQRGRRVTLSDALDLIIDQWLGACVQDRAARLAITGFAEAQRAERAADSAQLQAAIMADRAADRRSGSEDA